MHWCTFGLKSVSETILECYCSVFATVAETDPSLQVEWIHNPEVTLTFSQLLMHAKRWQVLLPRRRVASRVGASLVAITIHCVAPPQL